ncbi:hypothetical protein [Edaphovirga cremea]|uniref:hypothetical protein n=1 Tax=Edaphovirga cremea TaxID=2267246 RepID=UPI003989173F
MSSNPIVTSPTAPLVVPAPTIAETIRDADGLIHYLTASKGITVECRVGAITLRNDWIGLEWRTTSGGTGPWTVLAAPFQIEPGAPTQPPIPPITTIDRFVPAPAPEFAHSRYEIRTVQYRNAGGAPGATGEESFPCPLNVDVVASYATVLTREEPDRATFNNVPVGTVIDSNFLSTQPGVSVGVPQNSYGPVSGRFELGDLLHIYFGPDMFPNPQYLVSGAGEPMTATGATFLIPSSTIVLSGLYYLIYVIQDFAGNLSRPSIADSRTVTLLPTPVPFPLFFPLADAPNGGSTDDLLDVKNYKAGIVAEVIAHPNAVQGLDQYEMRVAAQPYLAQSPPLITFPVTFDDTYGLNAALKAAYTVALGPMSVTFDGRVERNGVFIPIPPITRQLDLSVEGATLPGVLEPGDPNPNLNPLQVFGAASTELNTLRIAHANQPVTITIALWTVPPLPHGLNDIWVEWGASHERVGPFNLGGTITGNFTFTVPWSLVVNHGNGLGIPVRYIVTGPGTTNENLSLDTLVDVIDAVTEELDAAEFGNLVFGLLTCGSLKADPSPATTHYAEVVIPADSRLVAGNTLTITLTLTNQHTALPPGPFTLHIPITVNVADLTTDRVVRVPYRPFLAQAVYGPIEMTYTTVLSNGADGHGIKAEVYTIFSEANSYCDGIVFP